MPMINVDLIRAEAYAEAAGIALKERPIFFTKDDIPGMDKMLAIRNQMRKEIADDLRARSEAMLVPRGDAPPPPETPKIVMIREDGKPSSTDIEVVPVRLVLFCPAGHPHIDEGEWATKPHKTHQCQFHDWESALPCGLEWRPADFATVGVAA